MSSNGIAVLGLGFGNQPANDDVGQEPTIDPTRFDPLVIEVGDSEGSNFRVVDWLGPACKVTWPINALPKAEIPVRLAEGWLVNDGTDADPVLRPLEEVLPDDAWIQIRTARPNPDNDQYLFRGRLESIVRGAGRVQTLRVGCEHLARELADNVDYALYGQLDIRKADHPYSPFDGPIPRIVEGLPRVYNPDGAPNCRRDTVRYDEIVELPPGQPATFHLPLFAHTLLTSRGTGIERQPWTWARVFLDLFFWARRRPDGTLGAWPTGVADLNLWKTIEARSLHLVDPRDLEGGEPPADPWDRALLATPHSHAVDGMSWLEALTWTCFRCGVGFRVLTTLDEDGQPVDGLEFFVPGEGERRVLKLPSPHYTTHDKDWGIVRANADVQACQITSDYGACVNETRVAAGPYRYEITTELVPGWFYKAGRDPQVDVDPGDDDAVADAQAIADHGAKRETWTRKYTNGPGGFAFQENWEVLRRWVLPEFEDMTAITDDDFDGYPRPWGPFGADRYALLDLSDLLLGELQDGDGTFQGGLHVVRPRPLGPCLSGRLPGQAFQQLVEWSPDGGGTWIPLPGGATIFRRRLGLWLSAPDLRDIVDTGYDGASEMNFCQLYIAGRVRLRVTGTIEGDESAGRPEVVYQSGQSLSRRRRGAIQQLGEDVQAAFRDDLASGFSGGNSQFKGNASFPATERNDDQAVRARSYLERGDRVKHTGPVEIPGLLFPYEVSGQRLLGYLPGEEVEGIVAEDGHHEHDVPLRGRMDESYAVIGAVMWNYDPGQTAGSAARSTTRLLLEDPGKLVNFG